MGGVKTISIIVAANIKGLEASLGKANKSIAGFASQAARVGSMLSFGVTAPLAAMGKQAFDTFSNFENAMMKVNTVTGATTEEFKMLTAEAKRLGATTQFTATQVADLQLVLGRKGFDPTAIKNMEQSILDLALATGEDLSLAAETVSTSINAFQLESSHATKVANTLASAAANSSIQLNTFATAFGHAGASANAVGVDLDRLAAMMGVLMDNGIKASKAGTGLRKIFMKLNKEGVDFTKVLDLATQGEMGLRKAMKLAGVTSANQLLILANNKDKVAELTKEYKTNTGRLKEMADAMGKTTFAKVKKMQSAIESMNIELGALLADAILPIIDKVTNLASEFSLLDDDTKKLIITIGGVMAAIGPVMMGMGALISLISPVTIGVAALATAFISLAHSSRETKSPLEKEQNALKNLAARAMGANEGTEKRIKLIKELQTKYPNFLTNLNAEKVENEAIKKALEGANESLLKKMRFQAESKKIQALMAAQNEANTKVIEAEDKANEGLRDTYEKLGVKLNENLSTQQQLNRVLDDGGRFVEKAVIGGYEYVQGQVQGIKISQKVKAATAKNSEELGQATKSYDTATDALKDYLKFLEEIGSTAGQILDDPTVTPIIDPTEDDEIIEYDGSSLLPFLRDYETFLQNIEDKTKAAKDRINEFWGGVMTNFSSGLASLFDQQTEMVTVMVDGVEEMQERTLSFGEKFGNLVVQMLKSIAKMIIQTAILAALMSIIFPGSAAGGSSFLANFKNIGMGGGLFDTLEGRASGGPVLANTSYMVGENGPELFNPGSTSGTIIPNHALGGSETVIPDVRISGDDLLIVFDKAQRRKSRR
jgi:vacuolar-type H+-ATPase subunit E/Vma4